MKKHLVAAAVSAAVMAPVGAQAEVTVYGRINNGITFNDPGGTAESTTDVSGFGSRFGFKASSDLGNGLTARGRYEFAANSDKKVDDTFTRIATVGLAGGFGAIDVGQQGAAFYGTLGYDQSLWHGGIDGRPGSRSSNTIKYSNSVGPLNLTIDYRQNDSQEAGTDVLAGNGGALGISIAVTDNITLALAYDTDDMSDKMTDPVYGSRYTFDGGDVAFFDLDHTDNEGGTADTWESGEAITGLTRVGNTGDVYCLSDAMVSEKTAKIRKHNADETPDTAIEFPAASTDNGGACQVSAAKMGDESDSIGASAYATFGSFWGSLSWVQTEKTTGGAADRKAVETDYTQLWAGVSFTDQFSGLLGYGQSEADGAAAKPTSTTLGLSYNLGGGLRSWYEVHSDDPDTAADKSTTHRIGLRYDF